LVRHGGDGGGGSDGDVGNSGGGNGGCGGDGCVDGGGGDGGGAGSGSGDGGGDSWPPVPYLPFLLFLSLSPPPFSLLLNCNTGNYFLLFFFS
jgi:hypothetical protein